MASSLAYLRQVSTNTISASASSTSCGSSTELGLISFEGRGRTSRRTRPGIRPTDAILRKTDEIDEIICGAQILAEDSKKPVAVLLTKSALGV